MKKLTLAILAGIALLATTAVAANIALSTEEEPTMKTDVKKEFSTDHLTPLQKKVTLKGGTEPAFKNEYWDNKKEGIYVDIIDGTPLFSSTHKYESGTGWPSFTQPIEPEAVSEHADNSLFMKRTEIKSASTDAHLGHVFTDGPKDAGGLRYCMNSASMKFIPKEDMEAQGYGAYLKLFE